MDEVRARLSRIPPATLTEESQVTHKRAVYFLDLASRALARQDLQQADILSDRALVLTQELNSGR